MGCLFAPFKGVAVDCRVGNRVKVSRILVSGQIIVPGVIQRSMEYFLADCSPITVRIMLVDVPYTNGEMMPSHNLFMSNLSAIDTGYNTFYSPLHPTALEEVIILDECLCQIQEAPFSFHEGVLNQNGTFTGAALVNHTNVTGIPLTTGTVGLTAGTGGPISLATDYTAVQYDHDFDVTTATAGPLNLHKFAAPYRKQYFELSKDFGPEGLEVQFYDRPLSAGDVTDIAGHSFTVFAARDNNSTSQATLEYQCRVWYESVQ